MTKSPQESKKRAAGKNGTRRPRTARTRGRPVGSKPGTGRDKLAAICRELLRSHSPDKITYEFVAKTAKVNPTLLRYYFKSKEDIFLAVIKTITDENVVRLHNALKDRDSSGEMLLDRIRQLLSVYEEDPHYLELMFDYVIRSDTAAARKLRREINVPFFSEVSQAVRIGVLKGELRPVDARMLHVAILGMCQAFTNIRGSIREFSDGNGSEPSLDDYARFAFDLVMHGIGLTNASRGKDR